MLSEFGCASNLAKRFRGQWLGVWFDIRGLEVDLESCFATSHKEFMSVRGWLQGQLQSFWDVHSYGPVDGDFSSVRYIYKRSS